MTQPLAEEAGSRGLPAGWSLRRVDEMGRVLAGKALNVHGAGPLRPYLRTKNVLDGRIDLQDVLWMPMTDMEFEHFRIVCGDVLLNEGQSLELVGRCSIYRDEFGAPCAMQNQLLRFRARTGTSPEFAAHLFRRCQQTGKFSAIATQTTSVAHLGSSRFSNLNLLWPADQVEQQAIADALTDVDDLIVTIEHLIAKKQAIKQGMMQQLLGGKTRLPGFSSSWVSGPLKNFMPLQRGFDLPTSKVRTGPYPVVYSNGVARYHATPMAQGPGVVTGRSGTIGKVHFVEQDYWPHNTALWVTSFARVDAGFAYYFLTNLGLERFASGSGVPTLNRNDAHSYEIHLPAERREQEAIARVLADADDEIGALRLRLDKARAIKTGMMQQLLTGRTRLPVQEIAA